jgi:hypothetical protein
MLFLSRASEVIGSGSDEFVGGRAVNGPTWVRTADGWKLVEVEGRLPRVTSGEGFYVMREPRSDRGVKRKPEKEVKETNGKRGRPKKLDKATEEMIASELLTRGKEATRLWLANGGIKVSNTLLDRIADEAGIVFARGRKKKQAA